MPDFPVYEYELQWADKRHPERGYGVLILPRPPTEESDLPRDAES